MATDLNVVTIVGRLTRDPELRATAGGNTLASLRIASNASTKNNTTGEWEDAPGFFDVTLFGRTAESASRNLSKGARIAINGRLQYREWETDGNKRSAVSIVANTVQYLDPKGDRPAAPAEPASTPAVRDDDDIPF